MQYACDQSHVPGSDNQPPSHGLLVKDGVCTESPYPFLSFVPTYTDGDAGLACTLLLFAEAGCTGSQTNLTISDGKYGMASGVCAFKSGMSVELVCAGSDGGLNEPSDNAGKEHLSS